MDGKTLVRIAGIIFVAFAVTATALEMTRKKETSAGSVRPPASIAPSALREGLRRCQSLGEAALLDRDCSRLWAEQRDRFLGFNPPSGNAAPGLALPHSPDATGQGAR
ncbi:putative entry exclusion protein TrbK-alt [Mesorhizobium sp. WSM3224]|uniref:putative entry exclusion protein TrbK-alt n=1 Tax=Mesorhizobium sp. WSM3224 TaxID=1040986 RepID=UPI00040BE135|nr:putative entry exclusion protein TrbK-alt [Mesorhizobium sp. WSM3224]